MFSPKCAPVLTVFLFYFLIEFVSCHVDYYCSMNTFLSNSSHLQFTKEVSTTEYAVLNQFKSLHCCAKGYRSIEWYKDSRPYPWAGGVSSFILYSDAANQTVYTQQAVETDSGNYTCVLKNDTHTFVHSIVVIPVEKPPSAPKATVTPKDQWAEIGQSVRFYCEAFVGRINLPDVRNDILWRRIYPEGTKPPKQSLQQKKINREEEQVIGAYFVIDQVRTQDYGQYECTVSNADSHIKIPIWLHHKISEVMMHDVSIPWKSLLMIAIASIALIIFILVIYFKFGRKARLSWIETFNKNSKSADKEYDVFVLFTSSTALQTLDYFIPTLQNKYSYKCLSYRLPESAVGMFDSVERLSAQCRCIVAILHTAEFISKDLMYILVKIHTLSLNSRPTLICLQELPKVEPMLKNENGENLQSLLKKTNVLLWESNKDKEFWIKLRLQLPCCNNQPRNTPNLSQTDASKTSVQFSEYDSRNNISIEEKNEIEIVV